MKILAETHTHTNACSHAYNSLYEMVRGAKERGMELIAITDHAPAMPDGPHEWHFMNLKVVPRKIDGIYVLRGAEANIMDMDGSVDLKPELLSRLDLVIASIHVPCLAPATPEEHTNTYLKVLQNPYIDVLGHCGSPDYSFDIERVLAEAKKQDKMIEINNNSLVIRRANEPNCRKIAKRCAEMGVKIVISTDAHSVSALGRTEGALRIAEEAGIPEELVMNTTAEKLLSYLCRRKGLRREMFENEYPDGLEPDVK